MTAATLSESAILKATHLRASQLGMRLFRNQVGAGVAGVILREVERDARRIALHTDERSAKYSQIVRNPAVSLLGWDSEGRLQVRLNGRASLHTGDSVAQAAWDELPMASRQLYRGRQLPGTPLAEPLPEQFSQNPDEIAFKAFAVIAVVIDRIETLRLTDRGHIRARFEWLGNQPATATWLVP